MRESDPRSAQHLALAADIQAGAISFADHASEVALDCGLAPHADADVSARWCAATLARLLLVPDEEEIALLGAFEHDVNLGTHALAAMIDGGFVRRQITARGLSAACTSAAPPMWLAGSFARIAPAYAYLYALFGANRLPADVFEERATFPVRVGLFRASGEATLETVTVHRTGLGELRLRIPVSRTMAIVMIAVPLATFAPEGLLHGVTVQAEDDVRKAAETTNVTSLDAGSLTFAGLRRSGEHYRVESEDGCLLITVGASRKEIAVYTIAITPLGTAATSSA